MISFVLVIHYDLCIFPTPVLSGSTMASGTDSDSGTKKIFVIGHSFISRLEKFWTDENVKKLNLNVNAEIVFRGFGGARLNSSKISSAIDEAVREQAILVFFGHRIK